MELIELNINNILLLDDFKFKDPYNDIDFLNHSASLSNNLDQQISLLKQAAHKVEKFHSFFHFEQSFFHLQLALKLFKNNKEKEAREQLELAIFQDHCNDQAIAILERKICTKQYIRIYENFADYLSFATEEKVEYSKKEKGYWLDYLDYQQNLQEGTLEKIIDKIRQHHLKYHIEAAKLYLNRAIVFFYQNQLELAKNDLRKAFYLDNKVKEKEYYLSVENLINFRHLRISSKLDSLSD